MHLINMIMIHVFEFSLEKKTKDVFLKHIGISNSYNV